MSTEMNRSLGVSRNPCPLCDSFSRPSPVSVGTAQGVQQPADFAGLVRLDVVNEQQLAAVEFEFARVAAQHRISLRQVDCDMEYAVIAASAFGEYTDVSVTRRQLSDSVD